MRIPLHLLGLAVLSLLVGGLVAGLARPPAASAASRGTGSLGTADYDSCVLRNGQAYCWGGNTLGQLVGFQNSASTLGLVLYATRSYSLMRPPRTARRLIRS
jgi:hypothetical protein